MTDASVSRRPPQQDSRVIHAEENRWSRELEKFQNARLGRVQASARVWLGVLTTLLGLLGSVVLLKGGDLVTEVTASGLFQTLLIVLVGLVFGVTVLAVIFGGQATWGGTWDPTQPADYQALIERARWWVQPWLRFTKLLAAGAEPRGRGGAENESDPPPWKIYEEWSRRGADRCRLYLHASRAAGVIAAGLIALLAILAVIAGTVSPAPADVVVVHHGLITCRPVGESLGLTGVSQVVTVSNCKQ